jgi:hypothetical protein
MLEASGAGWLRCTVSLAGRPISRLPLRVGRILVEPVVMKLIALDQNAISNLAFLPSPIWSEIYDLLRVGVSKEAILCPTPTETISESVHLSRPKRDGIECVCAELSHGYFFRFPWQIIALEALAKVRPGIDTFPLWIPPRIHTPSEAENEASSRTIRLEKTKFEDAVNPILSEEEKSAISVGDRKEFPKSRLAYMSAVGWLRVVRGYLNKLRNDQMLGDEQFIIQQICGTLVELRITDKEIAGLLRNIQRGEWLKIPMLACWFALDGVFLYDQLHRGRRFEYNDEWDKYRAGDAFHCAHCFITDRGMASAIRQAGLRNSDNFEVFSIQETKGIVAYLKAAIDSAVR